MQLWGRDMQWAVNNEKSLMMNTGNGTVEKQEGVLVVLKKEVKAYVAKE